jgi:hypothetical protein
MAACATAPSRTAPSPFEGRARARPLQGDGACLSPGHVGARLSLPMSQTLQQTQRHPEAIARLRASLEGWPLAPLRRPARRRRPSRAAQARVRFRATARVCRQAMSALDCLFQCHKLCNKRSVILRRSRGFARASKDGIVLRYRFSSPGAYGACPATHVCARGAWSRIAPARRPKPNAAAGTRRGNPSDRAMTPLPPPPPLSPTASVTKVS